MTLAPKACKNPENAYKNRVLNFRWGKVDQNPLCYWFIFNLDTRAEEARLCYTC